MRKDCSPAPLRRITDELIAAADGYARRKVRLECGHEVWCSGGAIYQARCRHCRAAQPGSEPTNPISTGGTAP